MTTQELYELLCYSSQPAQQSSLSLLKNLLCRLGVEVPFALMAEVGNDHQFEFKGIVNGEEIVLERDSLLGISEANRLFVVPELCFEARKSEPKLFARNSFANERFFERIGFAVDYVLPIPIILEGKAKHWLLLLVNEPDFVESLDYVPFVSMCHLFFAQEQHRLFRRQYDEMNHWIGNELSSMANIQQALHPDKFELPGVDSSVIFRTFKYVGGDYYDLVDLSQYLTEVYPDYDDQLSAWGLVIADVSGHGPGAAIEAAMLDAILRTFKGDFETAPAEVINYLNQHFFTRKNRGNIVTLFTANYEPVTQVLRYASAGHPPAIVRKSNGEIILLDKSQDIPLGVLREYQWEILEVTFEPGDLLLAYTDGVIESTSPAGEEFGIERVVELVRQHSGSAQSLLESIDGTLNEFLGGKRINDDQTLIAIKNTLMP
ncbi:PP2C family protein-serine/threonine phosphatase [Pleionea sp. CnH1-48]|uniref:PP2C family protein-serine/threonine phosphatase n=1 Tax=Pleionea sp. CnH1-48 TaxID=2954494 RepID=UPI00209788E9|nr:PP2C family protein-serine/threonine phosphatase [Pleionea sp. CnH1-48]MCO7225036.1 PP2C family protein-serine/threonine phosphatase [Pleionea sp. CnH1-48]